MAEKKIYRAIGLMSGTSLDGIDVALIETDGYAYVKLLDFKSLSYEGSFRERLRASLGQAKCDPALEQDLTQVHVETLQSLGWKADIIGFHGQTIFHNPKEGVTVQMGDGAMMATEIGIGVVNDFRSADVKAGGQGAPFLPLYHRARVLADDLKRPVVILNIGGVANVTWIGSGPDDILAFDTGPGNALIDDFVRERTGAPFDKGGALARKGSFLNNVSYDTKLKEYASLPPPKSLDRDAWTGVLKAVSGLSTEDGAATLTAFTVETIKWAAEFFPETPQHWFVAGGGRHNIFMMGCLKEVLAVPVQPVEDLGWNGDALEAEGFAYLAVRSLLGEPLSLPSTTGVPTPQTGGVLYQAA